MLVAFDGGSKSFGVDRALEHGSRLTAFWKTLRVRWLKRRWTETARMSFAGELHNCTDDVINNILDIAGPDKIYFLFDNVWRHRRSSVHIF